MRKHWQDAIADVENVTTTLSQVLAPEFGEVLKVKKRGRAN